MCSLMTVCPMDLEKRVSKILPNHTTVLEIMTNEF